MLDNKDMDVTLIQNGWSAGLVQVLSKLLKYKYKYSQI